LRIAVAHDIDRAISSLHDEAMNPDTQWDNSAPFQTLDALNHVRAYVGKSAEPLPQISVAKGSAGHSFFPEGVDYLRRGKCGHRAIRVTHDENLFSTL
jgi:hypothetical protein